MVGGMHIALAGVVELQVILGWGSLVCIYASGIDIVDSTVSQEGGVVGSSFNVTSFITSDAVLLACKIQSYG